MTAPSVRSVQSGTQRWLLALLAACFLVDAMSALQQGRAALPALPGALLIAWCAYTAVVHRPSTAALAAGVVLTGSTALIRLTGAVPASVAVQNLVLSEVVAGTLLVVVVVWRERVLAAIGYTAYLVFAAVLACLGRTDIGSRALVWSMQLGFLLLVVAVAVGMYLRGTSGRRAETEMSTLVGRQWPLAAAHCVLLFIDLNAGLYDGRVFSAVIGGGLTAACAFFAPRAPVRYALLGSAVVATATALAFTISGGVSGSATSQFSLTLLAASMCLIAFVVRWAGRVPAAVSTVALVAANLVTIPFAPRFLGEFLMVKVFLFVVAIATGLYFRARDRERSQSIKAAVSGAQQTERLALARELHDVVAHHVTGIVVQAQAARLVADQDPAVAVQALAKIENSGTEALKAMRFLVASMRGAKPAGTSEATEQATSDLEADLRSVVEHFSGPPVRLEVHLPGPVPQEVGRSVLRLVQESLTNAGKHALGATLVDVRVEGTGTELHVRVTDDGTGRRANPVGGSGGYGLVGMRERVELLGGRFTAGPADSGGWRVRAWLPLGKEDT